MAASATMQSMLASPLARGSNRAGLAQFAPSVNVPRLTRRSSLMVRSMSQSPKPKTSFSDIFAFSGPGPERINGRLAMIGFVAAIGVELANGQDLFAQVSNGGIPLFLGTSAVLTAASLVPLFKGVSAESKSDGVMTSDAEIWNGRFAMMGLVALALTEFVKGSALV